MRRRVGWIGVGVCLGLMGCVPSEDMQTRVANPFDQVPDVQQHKAGYAPATEESARRVDCLGQELVRANPSMALRPMFLTVGSPQLEIFHRGQTEVYVTEGLARHCVTDGQLAALLCTELGRMVAEREIVNPTATRDLEREPPPNVPIGNESNVMGAADGTRRVELAKFERDRIPRDVTLPPPSPDILARGYLQKAGFTLEDLDAAAPLLHECEANGALRRQIIGSGF